MDTTKENFWQKNRTMIKGLIIGALVLILLIPMEFVKNLIYEREARQKEAIIEVSSKWSGTQNITGPIIVLPYWYEQADTAKKISKIKRFAYLLPDEVNINSTVKPQERSRGIYKVMLYTSINHINGVFKEFPSQLNIDTNKIIWQEAFVRIDISDTKGLNEELKIKWNNIELILSPQVLENSNSNESLTALLYLSNVNDLKNINFSSDITLSGTEQLLFTPLGKKTTVSINSSWQHPSFTGNVLPQTSNINKEGFNATWKNMAHNRKFPQYWKEGSYDLNTAAFGVDFFIPVNGYQKTMRSVKYAALCILLTFAAFFLVETINKKPVHLFHYGLIGLAMILFYVLLLSLSEYLSFNFSYVIAAASTIGLISWFVKSILSSGKLTTVLSFVLLVMYTYIFTLLQLQDYALLFGSIGLFIMLAVVMYFSKRINSHN
jgi:inner membrane protein